MIGEDKSKRLSMKSNISMEVSSMKDTVNINEELKIDKWYRFQLFEFIEDKICIWWISSIAHNKFMASSRRFEWEML